MTVLERFYKVLLGLMVLLLLSACGDKACVEADDWGYPKVWVPAGPDSDLTIHGQWEDQWVDPIDSGQVIIDADNVEILMDVSRGDQWTSWFGNKDFGNFAQKGDGEDQEFYKSTNIPNQECLYQEINTDPYDLAPKVIKANKDGACPYTDLVTKTLAISAEVAGTPAHTAAVTNLNNTINAVMAGQDAFVDCLVPCYFRYGMGLYLGLAWQNGGPEDIIVRKHIPDATHPGFIGDINDSPANNAAGAGRDGHLLFGLPSDLVHGATTRSRLYFTILDKFYEDNEGGYLVRIKEGTRSPDKGPFEEIVGFFQGLVDEIMERIYKGITSNDDYLAGVRAVLALVIIFFALSYMLGMVRDIRSEFVIKVLKIGVVAVMLTPASWDFFYNNLFTLFFNGAAEVSNMILGSVPLVAYDPQSPWYSVDYTLGLLLNDATSAKIWSLLLSNIVGILYIILLYASVILFFFSLLKAVIVYLSAYVAMACLLVVFPFFILFWLFGKTKELMEEWFAQMMAWSMQLIILFATLGMFLYIITYFMQQTLGFKVCWNTWWSWDIGDLHIYSFKFWLPDISPVMGNVFVDADGDGVREWVTRYIDIPYLDPTSSKAKHFISGSNFLNFVDIMIFAAAIFLMKVFMEFVPKLSDALRGGSGGSGSTTSIDGVAEHIIKAVKGIAWDSEGGVIGRLLKGTANVLKSFKKNAMAVAGEFNKGGGKSRGGINASGTAAPSEGAMPLSANGKAVDVTGKEETTSIFNPDSINKNIEARRAAAQQLEALKNGEPAPMADLTKVGTKEVFNTEFGGIIDSTAKGFKKAETSKALIDAVGSRQAAVLMAAKKPGDLERLLVGMDAEQQALVRGILGGGGDKSGGLLGLKGVDAKRNEILAAKEAGAQSAGGGGKGTKGAERGGITAPEDVQEAIGKTAVGSVKVARKGVSAATGVLGKALNGLGSAAELVYGKEVGGVVKKGFAAIKGVIDTTAKVADTGLRVAETVTTEVADKAVRATRAVENVVSTIENVGNALDPNAPTQKMKSLGRAIDKGESLTDIAKDGGMKIGQAAVSVAMAAGVGQKKGEDGGKKLSSEERQQNRVEKIGGSVKSGDLDTSKERDSLGISEDGAKSSGVEKGRRLEIKKGVGIEYDKDFTGVNSSATRDIMDGGADKAASGMGARLDENGKLSEEQRRDVYKIASAQVKQGMLDREAAGKSGDKPKATDGEVKTVKDALGRKYAEAEGSVRDAIGNNKDILVDRDVEMARVLDGMADGSIREAEGIQMLKMAKAQAEIDSRKDNALDPFKNKDAMQDLADARLEMNRAVLDDEASVLQKIYEHKQNDLKGEELALAQDELNKGLKDIELRKQEAKIMHDMERRRADRVHGLIEKKQNSNDKQELAKIKADRAKLNTDFERAKLDRSTQNMRASGLQGYERVAAEHAIMRQSKMLDARDRMIDAQMKLEQQEANLFNTKHLGDRRMSNAKKDLAEAQRDINKLDAADKLAKGEISKAMHDLQAEQADLEYKAVEAENRMYFANTRRILSGDAFRDAQSFAKQAAARDKMIALQEKSDALAKETGTAARLEMDKIKLEQEALKEAADRRITTALGRYNDRERSRGIIAKEKEIALHQLEQDKIAYAEKNGRSMSDEMVALRETQIKDVYKAKERDTQLMNEYRGALFGDKAFHEDKARAYDDVIRKQEKIDEFLANSKGALNEREALELRKLELDKEKAQAQADRKLKDNIYGANKDSNRDIGVAKADKRIKELDLEKEKAAGMSEEMFKLKQAKIDAEYTAAKRDVQLRERPLGDKAHYDAKAAAYQKAIEAQAKIERIEAGSVDPRRSLELKKLKLEKGHAIAVGERKWTGAIDRHDDRNFDIEQARINREVGVLDLKAEKAEKGMSDDMYKLREDKLQAEFRQKEREVQFAADARNPFKDKEYYAQQQKTRDMQIEYQKDIDALKAGAMDDMAKAKIEELEAKQRLAGSADRRFNTVGRGGNKDRTAQIDIYAAQRDQAQIQAGQDLAAGKIDKEMHDLQKARAQAQFMQNKRKTELTPGNVKEAVYQGKNHYGRKVAEFDAKIGHKQVGDGLAARQEAIARQANDLANRGLKGNELGREQDKIEAASEILKLERQQEEHRHAIAMRNADAIVQTDGVFTGDIKKNRDDNREIVQLEAQKAAIQADLDRAALARDSQELQAADVSKMDAAQKAAHESRAAALEREAQRIELQEKFDAARIREAQRKLDLVQVTGISERSARIDMAKAQRELTNLDLDGKLADGKITQGEHDVRAKMAKARADAEIARNSFVHVPGKNSAYFENKERVLTKVLDEQQKIDEFMAQGVLSQQDELRLKNMEINRERIRREADLVVVGHYMDDKRDNIQIASNERDIAKLDLEERRLATGMSPAMYNLEQEKIQAEFRAQEEAANLVTGSSAIGHGSDFYNRQAHNREQMIKLQEQIDAAMVMDDLLAHEQTRVAALKLQQDMIRHSEDQLNIGKAQRKREREIALLNNRAQMEAIDYQVQAGRTFDGRELTDGQRNVLQAQKELAGARFELNRKEPGEFLGNQEVREKVALAEHKVFNAIIADRLTLEPGDPRAISDNMATLLMQKEEARYHEQMMIADKFSQIRAKEVDAIHMAAAQKQIEIQEMIDGRRLDGTALESKYSQEEREALGRAQQELIKAEERLTMRQTSMSDFLYADNKRDIADMRANLATQELSIREAHEPMDARTLELEMEKIRLTHKAETLNANAIQVVDQWRIHKASKEVEAIDAQLKANAALDALRAEEKAAFDSGNPMDKGIVELRMKQIGLEHTAEDLNASPIQIIGKDAYIAAKQAAAIDARIEVRQEMMALERQMEEQPGSMSEGIYALERERIALKDADIVRHSSSVMDYTPLDDALSSMKADAIDAAIKDQAVLDQIQMIQEGRWQAPERPQQEIASSANSQPGMPEASAPAREEPAAMDAEHAKQVQEQQLEQRAKEREAEERAYAEREREREVSSKSSGIDAATLQNMDAVAAAKRAADERNRLKAERERMAQEKAAKEREEEERRRKRLEEEERERLAALDADGRMKLEEQHAIERNLKAAQDRQLEAEARIKERAHKSFLDLPDID